MPSHEQERENGSSRPAMPSHARSMMTGRQCRATPKWLYLERDTAAVRNAPITGATYKINCEGARCKHLWSHG
eukprot:9048698-Pyramimonas_sp.AAC.1